MSQQLTIVADAVQANGDYIKELPAEYGSGHPEAVVQTKITGTATVTIYGRLSPDFAWVELVPAATADEISPITYLPEIRVEVTGYASGEVTVGVLTG